MPYYIHHLKELSAQAQKMAKEGANERLAITLQCVAIGSMIVTATTSAAHLIRDLFRQSDQRGRD